MRRLPLLIFALIGSCVAAEPDDQESPTRIRIETLGEASGMTVSRHDPELLWLANDSGASPTLHLCDTNGAARGSLQLLKIKNTDWEDLASFEFEGKPYLLIADTGDNQAIRKQVALHLIAEPEAPGNGRLLDAKAEPEWTIRFRYEDGPRDCESVAVDEKAGKILLVSKRNQPPAIYELPLKRTLPSDTLVAKRLGPLAHLPIPPTSRPHPYGSQPTSFDLSVDGTHAVALTYRGAYGFRRKPSESWAKALSRAPEILADHKLHQAEALALSASGDRLYMTSEGRYPPLLEIPLSKTASP